MVVILRTAVNYQIKLLVPELNIKLIDDGLSEALYPDVGREFVGNTVCDDLPGEVIDHGIDIELCIIEGLEMGDIHVPGMIGPMGVK